MLVATVACFLAIMKGAGGGEYSSTKVYIGGCWIDLVGRDVKQTLQQIGLHPLSCWVTRG